ncbi:hypothetical protein BDZ91DRAFT_733870 [Kalaharituber pfeilii]|nr:hypothetical protein BDZ91DRAFT_733870 [Kalaharituber pfeilii]
MPGPVETANPTTTPPDLPEVDGAQQQQQQTNGGGVGDHSNTVANNDNSSSNTVANNDNNSSSSSSSSSGGAAPTGQSPSPPPSIPPPPSVADAVDVDDPRPRPASVDASVLELKPAPSRSSPAPASSIPPHAGSMDAPTPAAAAAAPAHEASIAASAASEPAPAPANAREAAPEASSSTVGSAERTPTPESVDSTTTTATTTTTTAEPTTETDQMAGASAPKTSEDTEPASTEEAAPPEPSKLQPFVRPYDSSIDFYDCLEICHQSASPRVRPLMNTPYKTLMSSIWCKPYLLFAPNTCFVLDDGSCCHSTSPPKGKAVGYIIGTPSTRHFISVYKSDYLPLLDVHYPTPHPEEMVKTVKELKLGWMLRWLFEPEKMEAKGVVDMEQYPAHFHIDLLEGWQGSGWGVVLLKQFEKAVGAGGRLKARGVHVCVDSANHRGLKWYRRNGFVEVTGEKSKGPKWMVKKLE